jgi:hypothetical protein
MIQSGKEKEDWLQQLNFRLPLHFPPLRRQILILTNSIIIIQPKILLFKIMMRMIIAPPQHSMIC